MTGQSAKYKVHCRECGLYLGRTLEQDFPIQITCPICEETHTQLRLHITGSGPITEFPNAEHKSWLSWIMKRNVEDLNASMFVQRITEHREEDFYEFPPSVGSQNGAMK